MENELSLIRKDLNEIKVELTFIKEHILDDEAELEVSDEVAKEVENSRNNEDDLVPHEEVFKKYCEWVL